MSVNQSREVERLLRLCLVEADIPKCMIILESFLRGFLWLRELGFMAALGCGESSLYGQFIVGAILRM